MAQGALAHGTLPVVSNLVNYFSPTRSPYYTVALAACFALAWVCDVTRHGLWLMLAVPAFLVAVMSLWLSFDAKNVLTEADHAEQLRFARSTSISAAVLALAMAGKNIAQPGSAEPILIYFYWVFGCCLLQILLFVFFSWALNKEGRLSGANRNYVQLTLLTSAFLVDTCINLALAAGEKDETTQHHAWTASALGVLWGFCVVGWFAKLFRIVKVVRPLEPPEPPQAAARGAYPAQ